MQLSTCRTSTAALAKKLLETGGEDAKAATRDAIKSEHIAAWPKASRQRTVTRASRTALSPDPWAGRWAMSPHRWQVGHSS